MHKLNGDKIYFLSQDGIHLNKDGGTKSFHRHLAESHERLTLSAFSLAISPELPFSPPHPHPVTFSNPLCAFRIVLALSENASTR